MEADQFLGDNEGTLLVASGSSKYGMDRCEGRGCFLLLVKLSLGVIRHEES